MLKWTATTTKPYLLLFVLTLAFVSAAAAQQWIQLMPAGGPPAKRGYPRAVFDAVNNRMIIFGGTGDATPSAPCGSNLNDTWILTNANGLGGTPTWTQLAPSGPLPPARHGHTDVYDQATNRMILFGGDVCDAPLNDVWVLSNANGLGGTPSWTPLSPAGPAPSARETHTAVYDSASNRMVVFGGNPIPGSCFGAVSDVWVLSNANGLGGTPTWTQLAPTGGPPPPRRTHTAVYDQASNRMTIFAGNNACDPANKNDVWVLDNANGIGGPPAWTQLTPLFVPPSGRGAQSSVYDSASNRMTTFGGAGVLLNNEVWVLTSANGQGGTPSWMALMPSGVPPTPRGHHSAVYDPPTNRMIVFAGFSDVGAMNDLWVLTGANGVPPPATLTLAPPTATNPVGAQHCVTATVKDAFGNPTPNVSVVFTVSGANPQPSSAKTTDTNGQAVFCYTGTTAGVDVIHAFADTNNNGLQDIGEPSGEATKMYVVLDQCPPSGEGQCEQTDGGGDVNDNQNEGDFSFIVRRPSTTQNISGGLRYVSRANGTNVQSVTLTSLLITGNTATFAGTCTNNGVPCTFVANVTDGGPTGAGDVFTISILGGPARGGVLRSGKIQVRPR